MIYQPPSLLYFVDLGQWLRRIEVGFEGRLCKRSTYRWRSNLEGIVSSGYTKAIGIKSCTLGGIKDESALRVM
jgi:hypothetical protein